MYLVIVLICRLLLAIALLARALSQPKIGQSAIAIGKEPIVNAIANRKLQVANGSWRWGLPRGRCAQPKIGQSAIAIGKEPIVNAIANRKLQVANGSWALARLRGRWAQPK
ncbi:MAG TPA: hypothetical protein VFV98_16355 [Vicinamibacterales bacterium]|nr:hypothetical protein [Vicinamibacterales bacterium]